MLTLKKKKEEEKKHNKWSVPLIVSHMHAETTYPVVPGPRFSYQNIGETGVVKSSISVVLRLQCDSEPPEGLAKAGRWAPPPAYLIQQVRGAA